MKTEARISQQDVSSVNTKCGIYDDELGQDKGTCLQFGARETARRCPSKSGSDRTENESSDEDINEGEMSRRALEDDLNYEIMESVEGIDGRENTSEEGMYVDGFVEKEDRTNHYAEILTKTEPCSSTISMARRTRESSNPILCLRYGDRDTISSDIEDDRQSVVTHAQDDSVLYENTRTKTPSHPKVHHSRSDSEIAVYANTTRGWETTPDDSHVYTNFANRAVSSNTQMRKNDKRRNVSSETSDAESLYEDLDDVYEAMSPRTSSKPISIVYTSIDFPSKNASPSSAGSSSISGSVGSLEIRSRCTSCSSSGGLPNTSGKPPELPDRANGSLSRGLRPRSLQLGNHNVLTEFGLYTGTLVGSCTIMKTSPKSVQQIIGDFLAREKKERSKPVSLEVNNEFLRLSLNCAPWNLLAQTSVDDIGCVTTLSANNRTALGYTISKPGEDTRCYVIHCADADAIKNAILSTFKRSDLLSRWSSMSVLGTPRSGHSRSLPRTRSTSRHNELGIFDDLVYLGSYKVKKSYLVVNDNITSVLDHTDSKHYTHAKLELYKDAIHLKDSKKDRILDIHQLEWILSMGLFDEDRRYFGYISSKAFQGSKTRTFCHVFRCNRVGFASRILETIRQACQATFLTKTSYYPPAFRSRTNSSTSSSSEGSVSSSSETMSIGSNSSSPPDTDRKFDIPGRVKRRSRLIGKRNRMSTIRSFTEENTESDILEEKDEEKVEVAVEHRFNVFYLCSTIISPPLKPKHVKDCLKAYQKAVDKAMKKPGDSGQHYKKAQLVINQDGVMMLDDATKDPQAFFEKASLSSVLTHPKGKCAFAFTTVVSGNTKHKCHLFLQDKEPMDEITKVIQSNIQ